MGIYIFTGKPASIKDTFPKKVKIQSLAALPKYSPEKDDKTFLDVSGLDGAQIKELLSQAKNNAEKNTGTAQNGDSFLNGNIKLPSYNFQGWKKIKSGDKLPCYLLYCMVEGKTSLDTRYNEKTVAAIHKRFMEWLQDNLDDVEALLWMNSGKDCLFLIPPKQKYIEEAVRNLINILISAPLFTLENVRITLPLNFKFALHYGIINYKPPGKTGTVVSDAINFIFHLGCKKAETGRLTLSGELPGVTIPNKLQDCFLPVKDFEGRKIWHSKKFIYPKNWM